MKITILQHTLDTPPAFTTTWLQQNDLAYRLIQGFKGDPIPEAEEVDWLIVLGGGMNVDEEEKHPFLRKEKKLVEQILKADKTYLGLCLGGQMLARVMGAQVRPHSDWEVGWHPVQIENKKIGLNHRPEQEELYVFQWHQDTFDLPKGTRPFAKNQITPHQGFINESGSAIGVQFHPEADEAWVRMCAEDDEFPQGRFVQGKEEMLKGLEYLPRQMAWFSDLMSHLANRTRQKIQG